MKELKTILSILTFIGAGITLDQLWLNEWLFNKPENRTTTVLSLDKTYQLGNVLLEPKGEDSVLVNKSLELPIDTFKVQIAELVLRQAKQYSEAKRLVERGKPLLDSANLYYKDKINFDLLKFLEANLTPSVQGIYKFNSDIVRVNNQGQSKTLYVKPSMFDDELYFDTGEGFQLYTVDTVYTEPGGRGTPIVTEVVYTDGENTISKLLNL